MWSGAKPSVRELGQGFESPLARANSLGITFLYAP